MAKYATIPVKILRQLLEYNPETGELFWKPRPIEMFKSDGPNSQLQNSKIWNTKFAGRQALCARSKGYLVGTLLGQRVKSHRVAWAIANGEWPAQIDHLNHVRDDNRLVNLRSVSNLENHRNTKRHVANKSGTCGVYWSKQRRKWIAGIRANAKNVNLGTFTRKADAIAARRAADLRFGFHSNHGY